MRKPTQEEAELMRQHRASIAGGDPTRIVIVPEAQDDKISEEEMERRIAELRAQGSLFAARTDSD